MAFAMPQARLFLAATEADSVALAKGVVSKAKSMPFVRQNDTFCIVKGILLQRRLFSLLLRELLKKKLPWAFFLLKKCYRDYRCCLPSMNFTADKVRKKKLYSLGGDTDTLAAISGPMTCAYYQAMPEELIAKAKAKQQE